jgi:hypothetical protein
VSFAAQLWRSLHGENGSSPDPAYRLSEELVQEAPVKLKVLQWRYTIVRLIITYAVSVCCPRVKFKTNNRCYSLYFTCSCRMRQEKEFIYFTSVDNGSPKQRV